ncbi:MAG: NifB/NifX family molybdenum-iron cluster-binding protein [Syntrophomonadaceae bacterium]|nr:NifB/NifX family molybdenum-iron cluster-binding protein [Syntrophomonadaceae bacterium]MDD3023321.1 NifB/NifX family molybdenum-iron cluster-binding protein [Syntrophomonadaceae bacterium]
MKIGMPKDGESINQHFGQSKQFLIVTVEDGQVVEQKEVGSESLQHNHAGLSGLFLSEGVSLVITGGIGQPALNALTEKGLQVIRGASGRCEEVLGKYLSGELTDKNVICNHHGEHKH